MGNKKGRKDDLFCKSIIADDEGLFEKDGRQNRERKNPNTE